MLLSKLIKSSFLISITILFTSCANKNVEIEDIKKYPQEAKFYLNEDLEFKEQDKYNKKFFEIYFRVWDNPTIKISKKEANWAVKFKNENIYLQNYSKASKSWFEKHFENSNFEEFKTELIKAITIKNSNVRVLPTKEMMFYNPYNAGQGFPFDYNQNSHIKINTPVLISHFSKDKAWAYIKTPSFFGWINTSDLAFVDEKFVNEFKTNSYAITIKDKLNIYDEFFIEKTQLGTIFPISKNSKYLLAKKDDKHNAYLKEIEIEDENITTQPLVFNNENIEKIANELIAEQYGWGGIFGFRDCSSFTQDFYTTFGIYLGRNSRQQTFSGKYFNIKELSNEEKKEFIIKNAKPFKTLIYLKGHIMLYVGVSKDEPLVMHNVWGVKTKVYLNKKGRNIIGKNVITTLEFGKELLNYDDSNTVIDKLQGFVILDEEKN